MNFRNIMFAFGLAAAIVSCKKDDDGTTTPTLDGYLLIEGLPEFVEPSHSEGYTLSAKGVSHPEGGEIGYYWKVMPSAPTPCTTKVFTFKPTDTLQTVTVYCYAYAEGYASSQAVNYATVVKGGPDGSVRISDFPSEGSLPGGKYYEKQIGTQTWTVNNLAEGTGKGFRNSEIMADVFGRFYSHDEAVAACEALGQDWKLPSLEDWNTLSAHIAANTGNGPDAYGKSTAAALMGNATFNGSRMWEYWPSVGEITNATGFSAIPAGYANLSSGAFDGSYEYAAFWTATQSEERETDAYYIYILCDEPDMFTGTGDKESFGASVRCIRKM